ncbi:MAG: S9 family peptidase [Mycobacteriaceae bacterium]|nr:S9 family peptidase [Mycobacteriaceae bacterium]
MRATAAVLAGILAVGCGSASGPAADPYAWLEDLDSPRVHDWVSAENAKTLGVLESDPRYRENLAVAKELGNAPDRLPMPSFHEGRVENFWQDAAHAHGLWRETANYEAPEPDWVTLIDVDALAVADGKNWVWEGADCDPADPNRCLVSLSDGGEDAVTIREFDRSTRQFVNDGFVLPRGKQEVAWAGGDTLLVAREWLPGETTTSGYPFVVKRWRRGTPLAAAAEVARGDKGDLGSEPVALDDGNGRRLTLVLRSPSFWERQYSLLTDTGRTPLALPPKADVEGLVANRILIRLRQDWASAGGSFSAGSLVSLDVDEAVRRPDRLRATPVYLPGPADALAGVLATRDHVVVTSLHDVRGRAEVYRPQPDGSWAGSPVALPDNATVSPVAADRHGTAAYVAVTSFLTPTALWRLDTATGAAAAVKSAPARFDSSRYVVEQQKATSPDGTQVPYFLVHAAGMANDGTHPTVMYGYGGFGDSRTPSYDGVRGRLWLDRGGVFVLANIRGGGEYGPAWHEAARTVHRQRAFDDFAAVGRDVVRRGVTSPRHLGIQGGSNGGLLMGVEFTQHPELWNAVDIQVPLLDMERYEHIAAGASWVGEYGSVADPRERAFLESISPYRQLKPGVRYPKPFVWTTTKDDRVGPQHARKFAARLAELGSPYLFYEAGEGGHAAGSNIDEKARTSALEYTYLQRGLQ